MDEFDETLQKRISQWLVGYRESSLSGQVISVVDAVFRGYGLDECRERMTGKNRRLWFGHVGRVHRIRARHFRVVLRRNGCSMALSPSILLECLWVKILVCQALSLALPDYKSFTAVHLT